MVKLKKAEVKKVICPTCNGNGFVSNVNMEDGEKYVHQCWDCDSEGEYYVTTKDNLIGNSDYDDDNDLLEWLREIPVRRV